MSRGTLSRAQRGFYMVEAVVAAVFIATVCAALALTYSAALTAGTPVSDNASLDTAARGVASAFRSDQSFPPCGATASKPASCPIPDGALPKTVVALGYAASATATAVTFDPQGQTGTVAQGEAYRVDFTVTSPSGRKTQGTVLKTAP